MFFIRILVMAVLTVFLFMPTTINAELHSDTVIGNNAEWVDINRYITRGGVLLPLSYTSKQDLYGYPVNVVCILKETYYEDVIDLYKDLYDFKDITVYDDLGVIIYETLFPYDLKEAYREVKDAEHHEVCEISMVDNSEELGWPFVVEIEDEQSPIGNKLFWWVKW